MTSIVIKNKPKAIVIGASAGGILALTKVLPTIEPPFNIPIIIVLHLAPTRSSLLSEIFQKKVSLPIKEANEKEYIQAGTVYFAPPGYHLLIENDESFALSIEAPIHYSRPAIDILFETAADCYREGLIGMLLTGANEDGALGLKTIRDLGGLTIVQDPADAQMPQMPKSGLQYVNPECVLTLDELIDFFKELKSVGNL